MTTQPTLGLELRRPHHPSLFGLNSANISPRDVLSGTAGTASAEVLWLERIYGLWRRLTHPALFRAVRSCDSRGVELLVFIGVGRLFFLTEAETSPDALVTTLTRTPGENGFGWAVARFNLYAPGRPPTSPRLFHAELSGYFRPFEMNPRHPSSPTPNPPFRGFTHG